MKAVAMFLLGLLLGMSCQARIRIRWEHPAKPAKTALRARGGLDPHSCRPNASNAFCKGIPANCKAHPDERTFPA